MKNFVSKRVAPFALAGLILVLSACGPKSDGAATQGQNNTNNNGNVIDPTTSTITLAPTKIQISAGGVRVWNEVNGPGRFNGMRNLVRVFKLDSNYTGSLQLAAIRHDGSQCAFPNLGRNIRFTVLQNGYQSFVSDRFFLSGDGSDKFLIAKLEEVNCVTASFQFIVSAPPARR